jgi:hypothetical protein
MVVYPFVLLSIIVVLTAPFESTFSLAIGLFAIIDETFEPDM